MNREELKEKLDRMVWSYTRLSALEECPYSWQLTYLEHTQRQDNALAQWGSLMHSLLEENATGKLPLEDMIAEYEARFYFDITEPFPYDFKGNDLTQSYYNDGIGYLFQYNGIPERYKVIGAEVHINTDIGGHPFTGIIDLLLQDSDGEYVIVDHKSKKSFRTKKEQANYARQLYFYAKWVSENYGKYPKALVFNLFRANQWLEMPFVKADYDAALTWATNLIESAYTIDDFRTKLELNAERKHLDAFYDKPDYFCNNICDHRDHCIALHGGIMA